MFSGIPNIAIHLRLHQCLVDAEGRPGLGVRLPLLNYMDANGFDTVEPQHPGDTVDELPFMDFTPGYFYGGRPPAPEVGSRAPWRLKQNYLLRHADDPARQGGRRVAAVHQTPCAGGGFGLERSALRRRRRCRRRRCGRSRPARTPRHRTRRRRRVGRRRSWCSCAGLVPSALMPMSRVRSVAASRTAPLMISPTQPFSTPRPAMMSPTSAVCSEPSPSMTSTPPLPGSERTDFSSALSSKHLHGADRPGELRPAAELAQLQIAAADVGADLVDEVSGGARFDGHRSMLAIGPVRRFGRCLARA